MADWFGWRDGKLLLSVRVQPRAGREEIIGPHDGALKIRITAPPVDGRANSALITFLAKTFGVPRSAVRLLSGEAGRVKRLEIDSPSRLPAQISPQ